jgi:hypothetical protein
MSLGHQGKAVSFKIVVTHPVLASLCRVERLLDVVVTVEFEVSRVQVPP